MTNWKKKRLGELCEVEIGKTPYRGNKSFWDGDKVSENVWLSIADLLNSDGDTVSDSKEYITDKAVKISKIVKKGTLLVSFKLTLGRLAFAGKDLFTNEAIAALTIRDEREISKYFLFKFLSFFDWERSADGDVKVKGKTLNKAKLKAIEVFYPDSLSEQKRIVAILDEAFAAIDKAKANVEKNLRNARELFESYLQGVFGSPGADWEKKRLSEVAIIFGRGKSKHRPRNDDRLFGGEYPFIQTGDVRNSGKYVTSFNQTYNETGLKQSKLWPKGTICITIAANIAETAILDFDSCFPDSIIGLVVDPEKANSDFTYYALQFLKAELQLQGKGSAQDNINLGTFEKQHFPFPPLSKQMQIVEVLDSMQNETQKLETLYRQKLTNLEELKKSILQKAFAGKLTKPNAVSLQ